MPHVTMQRVIFLILIAVLTDQHIAEALSRVYVRAISGRTGLNLAIREYDYGVDGSFDEVVIRQNRRVESGFSLSFQLKASTLWQLDSTQVIYDLEAKTYNDLVFRRSMRAATPCILILLTLPNDSEQWLICEEAQLRLQGNCYWEYLSGSLSENRASVRIRIPRSQRLTPESLLALMQNVKTGEW
ncbi:DUF4365 domain-containing protein [Kovacikia minuta CCNUW1]|uniref:DUF4365 domain-containing protein n=1 Tax=Kovacikia minuta TaxID=2931930 RepID=UPI001CCD60D8|nr:DUF4365 domain-containing protein [Kovacikia minuta]UBF26201.1 DUF4365 domain-containing protein [Kovacikia minuta CCNUW1]